MATCPRSMFRVGAVCCAPFLLIEAPVLASEFQILPSPSCEARNEQNIRAAFSAARERLRLREQLVADLKSIRSDLTNERTWWGGDPTSDTSLRVALVLKRIKVATDVIFDLAEELAGPQACPISAVKSLAEKVVLNEGYNEVIAAKILECATNTPKNVFFETLSVLEKVEMLVNYVNDMARLTKAHNDLKNEVERQGTSLDRQIGQYEESNRKARGQLDEMERELRQAIRAYCAEEDAKAAEELQRVMDQTRAGVSMIAAKHRQVMDRVDAAREQRSDALTQQMQGTLQRMQQQQLMMLQQQQLRQELQRSQPQQRPAYEGPQPVQRIQQPSYPEPNCAPPAPTAFSSSGRASRAIRGDECY